MRFIIRAVGQMKAGPEKELLNQYFKRLQWSVTIEECKETEFLKNLKPDTRLIALDEHGALWSSQEFAEKIRTFQNQSVRDVVFLIGGADGLPKDVLKACHDSFALGRMTWPHLLVRGLLVEQLYRAQQILSGHPYHRE